MRSSPFARFRRPTRGRQLLFALALALVGLLPALPALADTPYLVKDINTVPDGQYADIQKLTDVNGVAFFIAWDEAHGYELWKSDGTAAGTQLLKDICPGECYSNIDYLTALGATLFFRAYTPDTGYELWKSDGTTAGTQLVKDIIAGTSYSDPQYLAVMGGLLYFRAYDPVSSTYSLWKSDGTDAGTVVVKTDVNPYYLTTAGSTIYFSGYDNVASWELWKSDGTTAGTVRVKDLFPGSNSGDPQKFTPAGSLVYFVAEDASGDRELWVTDGTSAGTKQIKEIAAAGTGSYPEQLTALGSKVLFTADNGTIGREVWVSDGTAAGTVLTKNIYAGITSSSPSYLTAANGLVFFSASDGTDNELWKSDGTAAGTVKLNLCAAACSSSPFELRAVGNTLFFGAYDSALGYTIWKSDGTLAGSIPIGTSNFYYYRGAAIGGQLFFVDTSYNTLWKSNGTAAGTVTISSIEPHAGDSNIRTLVELNDTLFFEATDGVNGDRLWASNGTAGGTTMVANNVDPSNLVRFNNKIFFAGYSTATGDEELWQSDGTGAGTALFKNLFAAGSSSPQKLTPGGSNLYFSAYDSTAGRELWISDGTVAGTVRLKNINAGGNDSAPDFLTWVGTKLFFTADNGTNGRELWVSDGTAAGTVLVKNITAGVGSTNFYDFEAVGNTLYFLAYEPTNGYSVWKSDGTAAGTVIVPGTANTSPNYLAALNGKAYFNAYDPTLGYELWVSDGTAAGTQVLVDLDASSNASPGPLVAAGNRIFFIAYTPTANFELWVTDGTAVGTQFVKDIYAGAGFSSEIQEMVAIEDKLFFQALDNVNGREWWISDGTPAGTQVIDTFPGSGASFAQKIGKAGTRAYAYALGDLTVGHELYAYDLKADVSLTKSDSPDPVYTGNLVNYTLTINNAGPFAAQDVSVSDTLPAGVTFVGASPACNQAAGVVTCTLGDLANGASANVTMTVQTTGAGTLNNTASVSATNLDPNAANNSVSATTTVLPVADLSLSKSDSPDPVIVGANLTYVLTVANAGPDSAANVTATDTLPAGVTFGSAGAGCSHAAGVVTCNLGTLASGATISRTIIVQPTAAGLLTNNATVTSAALDPNTANNNASVTTLAKTVADISLAKSDSADPVLAGLPVTYQLVVSNAGPNPAQSVVVTDTLPAGVNFVAASPACSHAAGLVTCNLGALAVAANRTVTMTVQTTTAGAITNNAVAMSTTEDPNLANNSDTEATTVNPSAVITIINDAVPDSATDFRFSGGLGPFYLDDITPQDADAYSNSKSFIVAPGAYAPTEVLPTTWALASITCNPAAKGTVNLALKRVTIRVVAGDNVTCTFTNHYKVSMNTVVYHDVDQDRTQDAGEPGLPGWMVSIYDASHTQLFTKTTSSSGAANFPRTLLPNATYKICVDVQAGWTRTMPPTLDPVLGKPCFIRTPTIPGQTITVRFGNKPLVVGAAEADEVTDVVEDLMEEETLTVAPDESGYDADYVDEEATAPEATPPAVEEPVAEQPVAEQPVAEQPAAEQPATDTQEQRRSLFLPLVMQ